REIDLVCIRENTEGEYARVGGRVHQRTAEEVAIQSNVFTRKGTERIMHYAFEYARHHGRKKVTSATKSKRSQYNMVFWDDVFRDVAREYPDITHEQQLIDSLAARFVSQPESLDVVVASNLFGDILTDLSAAITGSLGLAPSANLNPERTFPSMFEPVHGSAPDIVGKGIANPLATMLAGAMMVDFLGEAESAARIDTAVRAVLSEGRSVTPDLGGAGTTRTVTDAAMARLG